MAEKQDLKQIPYGIAHYNLFGEEHYYFVDKTQYIRNIETKGRYLFFIRPRRFGKTLFLSVLGDYYDIAQKDQFDTLFNGTDIQKNPTMERNKYLVFKLNFSLIEPKISSVEESFVHYIKSSAKSFIKKYQRLLGIDIKKAEAEFNAQKTASDVMISFLRNCSGKKEKIYVIIDEYDNFANTVLAEAGETEFQRITHGAGFLRAFFNALKGGTTEENSPISRLFMTGVSPITLDDVTSGFNIATNLSLDPDLSEMLGFTRSEVETIIEYYRQTGKIRHSTSELMEIMSRWYNHYRFSMDSDTEVFNPVQVLYFIRNYLIRAKIPADMIDRNARIDYKKLRHLIIIDKKGTPTTNGNFSKLQKILETGQAITDIQTGFPVDQVTKPENFHSLLFYFGLLTIRGETLTQQTILSIPNEFVKHLFYDFIKDTYEETRLFSVDKETYANLLEGFAVFGKWEPFIAYIAGRMEESLGVRDLIDREKALQVFWNVYLGLNSLYLIYSEKELNQGFSDLAMVPM
ncbi:MAG: AAA family ATPase, partial [Candidatus Omnitrophota bacterium]